MKPDDKMPPLPDHLNKASERVKYAAILLVAHGFLTSGEMKGLQRRINKWIERHEGKEKHETES